MPTAASGRLLDQLRLLGPSGSNKVMAAELSRIARRAGMRTQADNPRKDGQGALVVPFNADLAALCTRYHRTASRVLWDLYESRASRLEPLYADLVELVASDRRGLFQRDFSLSVQVRGEEHFAAGGRQLVGTVKNAIVNGSARNGVRVHVDSEQPDAQVMVRAGPEGVVVSLDLVGRPMNQRGYRVSGAAAPLRESLAAMLVMLARHAPRDEVLVDPMAGTGTIAIEAACLAQGRALWSQGYVPCGGRLPELHEHHGRPSPALFADTRACIVANEAASESASLLRTHVDNAGVADQVTAIEGDFRELSHDRVAAIATANGFPHDRGLILCNPPYGERLSPDDLLDLYRDFGHHCRTFKGFRVGVLVANPDFERAFSTPPRIKKPISNGQLRANFLLYDAQ